MCFRVPDAVIRGTTSVAVMLLGAALWCISTSIYGDQGRLVLMTVYLPLGALGFWVMAHFMEVTRVRERALLNRLAAEREAGKRMWLTAIESLAYVVEAKTPQNIGHLARVQACAVATARAMNVDEGDLDGIRAAALMHDIGRLGVPDNILSKKGALTEEEREKMRAYPVLGGRILATIPFPWPVAPIVRHHQERFDGSGYPDGLEGEQIPLGARILAVADAYDSLVSDRAHRPGHTHEEAMIQITRAAGAQFDPAVVAAFRSVVDAVNAELSRNTAGLAVQSAAYEIARAQREMQALYELACAVGWTLCLNDTLEVLARKIRTIVHSATCVIYLLEEDGEHLLAYVAYGVNHWHFRRSRARVGTYLTGRVASRAEAAVASYLADDILLWHSVEPWTPLRSTLIAPLTVDDRVIGTINLYHTDPDAFQSDDVRMMVIIGEMAGRAVENARLFAQTQETAFTDELTGLRNARYLFSFLDMELNRAQKTHHPLAVLGLDLDGFKAVNDTYGHDRGDQVLREIGQMFQAQVRNYDLVARYAGDEFTIVLPETDRVEAQIVALKIKAVVDRYADHVIRQEANFPRIGVSVGVAMFPDDAEDLRGLLIHADKAMYSDKRAGLEAERAA